MFHTWDHPRWKSIVTASGEVRVAIRCCRSLGCVFSRSLTDAFGWPSRFMQPFLQQASGDYERPRAFRDTCHARTSTGTGLIALPNSLIRFPALLTADNSFECHVASHHLQPTGRIRCLPSTRPACSRRHAMSPLEGSFSHHAYAQSLSRHSHVTVRAVGRFQLPGAGNFQARSLQRAP